MEIRISRGLQHPDLHVTSVIVFGVQAADPFGFHVSQEWRGVWTRHLRVDGRETSGRAYGGGLACGFLCVAFKGNGSSGDRLSSKDDSFSKDSLRVYRSSEQAGKARAR